VPRPAAAVAICAALLGAGLVAVPGAGAASDLFPKEPVGTVWLDAGADTTDVLDARIEIDVRATRRVTLRLGTGGTYIPTRSANVEAGYALVGAVVDTAPGLSAGGSYEYWGQEDALTTHTVAGSLTWRGRVGSFSVIPQARRIILYRQLVRTGAPSEESTGRGLDLVGTLYGPGGWEWTLGAAAWRYTGAETTLEVRTIDTRTLDTRLVDALVVLAQVDTRALLAPAAGFIERRLSGETAYDFGPMLVGLGGSVTRYVADERATYGTVLRLYLPVGRRHAVEVRAGRLFGGDIGPVTYGRVAMGYGF
jgi:hypothetical protein